MMSGLLVGSTPPIDARAHRPLAAPHQVLPLTQPALILERGRVVYSGASEALRGDRGLLDRWRTT